MSDPVAEASSSGTSAPKVRSRLNTSRVKTKAAIGVPKMLPRAPAVAQEIRRIRCLKPRRSQRARLEPMAAPVPTVGPSRPTEPPNPTVKAEPTKLVYMADRGIIPPSLAMAPRAIGIPSFMRHFRLCRRTMTMLIPIKGKRKYPTW